VPLTIHDEATVSDLIGPSEPKYLVGPDGCIIGHFVPFPDRGVNFEEAARSIEAAGPPSDSPDAKWYTTDEVVARLRSLDGTPRPPAGPN
jgi:hypothetical protein